MDSIVKSLDRCEMCKHWQDYEARVWAKITDFRQRGNTHGKGLIELRPCRYSPPPGLEMHDFVYTDKNFHCSGYELHTKT